MRVVSSGGGGWELRAKETPPHPPRHSSGTPRTHCLGLSSRSPSLSASHAEHYGSTKRARLPGALPRPCAPHSGKEEVLRKRE